MRKIMYVVMAGLLATFSSCDKDNNSKSCDLPASNAPAGLAGAWVHGDASATVVVDSYNGKYVGTGFKTGQYLKFDANGKNAELVVLIDGGYYSGLQSVTKMYGTIVFDEAEQTLEFKVCEARYRGWKNGSKTIDRAANADEVLKLTNNNRFYFDYTPGTNYPLRLWFQTLPVDDDHTISFRAG